MLSPVWTVFAWMVNRLLGQSPATTDTGMPGEDGKTEAERLPEIDTTIETTTPVHHNANINAFLLMIRYAEGTAGNNGYRTVFGGTLISNLRDHPAITGEWKGKRLSDAQCRGAGLGPGCISTAAGAYQFIRPTWVRLKSRLQLPDFSPESQDAAALELIREVSALGDVSSGRFDTAVSKVRKIWASMPGAGYAQPEKTLEALRRVYTEKGGVLA
jgi:muramidase (phage lysozyme)